MSDSLPLLNDNVDTPHPDVPVTSDKHPLVWGGNRAHIAGNLDAVNRFYVRTGGVVFLKSSGSWHKFSLVVSDSGCYTY